MQKIGSQNGSEPPNCVRCSDGTLQDELKKQAEQEEAKNLMLNNSLCAIETKYQTETNRARELQTDFHMKTQEISRLTWTLSSHIPGCCSHCHPDRHGLEHLSDEQTALQGHSKPSTRLEHFIDTTSQEGSRGTQTLAVEFDRCGITNTSRFEDVGVWVIEEEEAVATAAQSHVHYGLNLLGELRLIGLNCRVFKFLLI